MRTKVVPEPGEIGPPTSLVNTPPTRSASPWTLCDLAQASVVAASTAALRARGPSTAARFQDFGNASFSQEKILNFVRLSGCILQPAESTFVTYSTSRNKSIAAKLSGFKRFNLQSPVGALVSAYSRGWRPLPDTCHGLAMELRTNSNSFNWAVRRSPLVSVAGRDPKDRVLCSLNLE